MDDPKTGGSSSAKAIADVLSAEETPGRFLNVLLAAQCRQTKADAAAILRSNPAGSSEVLAVYPQNGNNGRLAEWIGKADKPFRKVIKSGQTVTVREDAASTGDGDAKRYLMVIPIENQGVCWTISGSMSSKDPSPLL